MTKAREENALSRKNPPKRSPTRSDTLQKQPERTMSAIHNPSFQNVLQVPRHLKLSAGDDGQTFLVPAWMLEPEAATISVVAAPRLPVARLLELRAFLDSGLASDLRAGPEGGADAKAIGEYAGGFVRTHAARQITDVAANAADEPVGTDPDPVDRSNNCGRSKGEER
jgi:hypothetical protein